MLKKIIVAFLSIALISSTGITAYAAENANENSDIVSLAEQGAALRKRLGLEAGDILYFDDILYGYDKDGNTEAYNMGSRIYLIDFDDVNQRVRIYYGKSNDNYVHYLSYSDLSEGDVVARGDGPILGDLDMDHKVDFFDLICLRKRLTSDFWNNKMTNVLSDVNADDKVTIADAVYLQRWLLGDVMYFSWESE